MADTTLNRFANNCAKSKGRQLHNQLREAVQITTAPWHHPHIDTCRTPAHAHELKLAELNVHASTYVEDRQREAEQRERTGHNISELTSSCIS